LEEEPQKWEVWFVGSNLKRESFTLSTKDENDCLDRRKEERKEGSTEGLVALRRAWLDLAGLGWPEKQRVRLVEWVCARFGVAGVLCLRRVASAPCCAQGRGRGGLRKNGS